MEQRGGPLIEITGSCRAVVDGCDGIVDYNGENIIVRAGRLTVNFAGRGLRLMRLSAVSAVIEGSFDTVSFGRQGDGR